MNTVFRLDSVTMGRDFREFLRMRNCQIRVESDFYHDELDWDDMTDEQKDEAYRVYFGKDR